METLNFIERRRHQRFAALLNQEEQALVQYGAKSVNAEIADLSAGGARLTLRSSASGFEIGSGVSLFLDNGGRVFELRAIVIRTMRKGLGVEFVDLTPTDERDIGNKIVRMGIIAARLEKAELSPLGK